MYTAGLFMLLSLLMKSMCTDLTPEEPLCYDPKTPNIKRCCAGFRTLGGKCYPCIGLLGAECSKPCNEGHYGIRCREKCQCNHCNKTTGECFNETTISNDTKLFEDRSRSDIWIAVLAGSLTSLGSLVILFWILLVKERKNKLLNVTKSSTNHENANVDFEADDYENIRDSHLVLNCGGACGGQKTLDRVSYAKTQTLSNPYNKLSFNRCKSGTENDRHGQLYDISSETPSQNFDVGEYVAVASEKVVSKELSVGCWDSDNKEINNACYVNIDYGQDNSEKPDSIYPLSKTEVRREKPKIKPKPANLHVTKTTRTKHTSNTNRPYSVANRID
ncbi:uncharacterized protein LOC125667137 isoform X3 [Ostrea edulis]|uniref:uncharacterized protein LOC125667137 isoform X3 n=1 Tax=Ostrea edulis TaxID=37623 RepID=UPI0024AFC445|nr:uncharacterized protein LOC125667137 isoform X3 [Ostrea edulis]